MFPQRPRDRPPHVRLPHHDLRVARGARSQPCGGGGDTDPRLHEPLVRGSRREARNAPARYAFEEALSWLDLASGIAGEGPEADDVNRRTAEVLRLAGWSEPPPMGARRSGSGGAIEGRDLDLGPDGERA